MKWLVKCKMRVRESTLAKGFRVAGTLCGVVLVLAAGSTTVFAHHSYAMFDMQKEVQVEGTVKEFRFTNPHSWIVLEVKDAAGNTSESRIEANGPGYLVRFGWKRTSLNPGDPVVVSMNPLRDGTAGGSLVKVVFKDGHELNAKPEPPKAADAGAKP